MSRASRRDIGTMLLSLGALVLAALIVAVLWLLWLIPAVLFLLGLLAGAVLTLPSVFPMAVGRQVELGIATTVFLASAPIVHWAIHRQRVSQYRRLKMDDVLQVVRGVWRKYPLEARTIRRVDDRADFLRTMSAVRAVGEGHIDFYSRHCASRVIDAAKVTHTDIAYIYEKSPLSDWDRDQAQQVEKDVLRLRNKVVAEVMRRFSKEQITKIVYYDNLANRNLAYEVAKRLARDADRIAPEPELVCVMREPKTQILRLEPKAEGRTVRSPIVDNDNVLILEANLGPIRKLETVVCLVKKAMPPTATLHVGVVFDGSEDGVHLAHLGIPRRRVWRFVRAELLLRRVEKCRDCIARNPHHALETFSFSDNYMP